MGLWMGGWVKVRVVNGGWFVGGCGKLYVDFCLLINLLGFFFWLYCCDMEWWGMGLKGKDYYEVFGRKYCEEGFGFWWWSKSDFGFFILGEVDVVCVVGYFFFS